MVYRFLDFGVYCTHSDYIESKIATIWDEETWDVDHCQEFLEPTAFEGIFSIDNFSKPTLNIKPQERIRQQPHNHIPEENSSSNNPKNPINLLLLYNIVSRSLIQSNLQPIGRNHGYLSLHYRPPRIIP